MKPWKDLSMKERGAFIRVGVKNGITSVDDIRDAYNKFACGGHKFYNGGYKKEVNPGYSLVCVDPNSFAPPFFAKGRRLAHRFDGGGDEESVNPELLSPLERVTTFDYGKEYIDEKGRHTGKSEGQQLVDRYNSYMRRYRNDMADAYYIMTEEYGFNPETASGIIGNILQESDGNYKKEQNGGTGPGRGLFQWEQASKGGSGSWEKYEKWLNGRTDSAANQVRYMCSEYIKNQHTPFTAFKNDHPKLYREHMETGKPDSDFISATNPDLRPYYAHVTDTQAKTMLYTGNPTESSLGFMQVVEKPKTPRAEYRAHFANQWYNDILYNGDKLKEGYYIRNKKK